MLNNSQPQYRNLFEYAPLEIGEFRRNTTIETEASLLGVVGRFTTGVLHGLTTINFNRSEPESVIEGIAQSLGTWVGITGMFLGGPVSWGAKLLTKAGGRAVGMTAAASKMPQVKSVPIWLGDKAVDGIKAANRSLGSPEMASFIARNKLSMDAAEGAVRIGSAMGVLSWQEGINGMITGGALGAFFGGSDRFIGNAIRGLRPELQAAIKSTDPKRLQRAERAVSMVSAGIVSGMPSTLMGQPWEYQVYDYLFGAWLGAEPAYVKRRAHRFVDEVRARGEEINIMHDVKRNDYKPYQDLLSKHTNPKVREGIREEIDMQVEFRFGQMLNNYSKAAVLMAMVDASGRTELADITRTELEDGTMAKEALDRHYTKGLESGMNEGAAEQYAMDQARKEYTLWKSGDLKPEDMMWTTDVPVEYSPDRVDIRLHQPVIVSGKTGIVTRVNAEGKASEVTSFDGAKLVYESGKQVVVADDADLANQRLQLGEKYTSITRSQFMDMVIASKYSEGSENIPEYLWDKFADIRMANTLVTPTQEANGLFGYTTRLGNTEVKGQSLFQTEAAAVRFGIERVLDDSFNKFSKKNAELSMEAQKILAEFDDLTMSSTPPALRNMAELIAKQQLKGDPNRKGIDVVVSPLRIYNQLYEMAVASMGKNPEAEALKREIMRSEAAGDNVMADRMRTRLGDLRDAMGKKVGWEGFLQRVNEMFPEYHVQSQDVFTARPEVQQIGRVRTGKKMTDKYDLKADKSIRNLRSWYRRFEKEVPVRKLTIQKNMKDFRGLAEYKHEFPNGKKNVEFKAPSYINRVLKKITGDDGIELIHIDSVYDVNRNKVLGLNNAKEVVNINQINEQFRQLWNDTKAGKSNVPLDKEYFVISGKKADDTLRAMPYLFTSRKEALDYLTPRIKGIEKYKPGFGDEVKALAKNASNETDFLRQYASTMRLWEGLNNDITTKTNRYPVVEMAAKRGFISTVANLNKRLQIMDAEGLTADPMFYGKSRFKALVVNTRNSADANGKREPQVKGLPEPTFKTSRDQLSDAEQHRDGSVIVSQKVFDQMLLDAGADAGAGALKGVTAFADKSGMFLGKYAMFRADDATNAEMNRLGNDLIYYTSTTKQLGKRKAYDMQLDGQTATYSVGGKATTKPVMYDIPVDGVTFNSGQGENLTSAMKKQKVPIQMVQSFAPHLIDRAITDSVMQEIYEQSIMTSPEAHQLLSDVEALQMGVFDGRVRSEVISSLKERVRNMDMDDIGAQDMYNILQGDPIYTEVGLFDKMVRHLHGSNKNQIDDMTRGEEIDEGMQNLVQEYATELDVVLNAIPDGELTPEITNSRMLRSYVEAVYRNNIFQKYFTPRLPYSIKSIGSQQDAWFAQKHGYVAEGTFMLGQGAKQMKVKAYGRDITLGKVFEKVTADKAQMDVLSKQIETLEASYKKETRKGYKSNIRKTINDIAKQLDQVKKDVAEGESALDMVVTRVPIEHASGVRALRFVGFSDEVGVTSKLNSTDMANLGGMDLDIDSVFIFQNIGKNKVKTADGEKSLIDALREPKVKNAWYDDAGAFRDPKNDAMTKAWEAVYDKSSNYATMFDPAKIIEGGRASAQANQSLGIIVNARRDLMAMMDKVNNELIDLSQLFLEDVEAVRKVFKDTSKVFYRKRTNAEQAIDELSRAGINISADAADLTSFVDPFRITSIMHKAAYEIVGEVKPGASKKDITKAMDILYGKSKIHEHLRNFNDARNGKSEKLKGYQTQNLTAAQAIEQMRILNRKLETDSVRLTKKKVSIGELPGSFFNSIARVMNIDVGYKPFDSLDISRMEAFYGNANKITNQKPKVLSDRMKSPRDTLGDFLVDLFGFEKRMSIGGLKKAMLDYNEAVRAFRQDNNGHVSTLKRAHDKLYDFMSNDMYELTSVISIYREAARLEKNMKGKKLSNGRDYDSMMMKEIVNQTSQFKMNYLILRADKASKVQSKNVKYKTFEGLESAMKDYKEGLPAELKRFYDMAGISNIVPGAKQTGSKEKFSINITNNPLFLNADPASVRDFYQTYSYVFRGMKSEYSNQKEFIYKIMTDDIDWISPIRNSDPYAIQPIPRIDLRVANLKAKKVDKPKKVVEPVADEDVPKRPPTAEDEPTTYRTWTNIRQKILADESVQKMLKTETLTAEEASLVDDLRVLFKRHPNLYEKFDTIFEGTQAYDLNRLARSPEIATMEDLRQFIGVMKGVKHGNLLSEMPASPLSQIKKWMYWEFPDKHHRTYAPIDLQIATTKARVITAEGVIDKDVAVLTSAPDQLRTMSNTLQLGIEIENGKNNDEVAKILVPIEQALGADLGDVWRYTVAMREHRDPEMVSSYTTEQMKLFRVKLDELGDRTYKMGEKTITVDDAVGLVDKAISDMNWRMISEYIQNEKGVIWADKANGIVNDDATIIKIQKSLLSGNPNNVWTPGNDIMDRIRLQRSFEKVMPANIKKGSKDWLQWLTKKMAEDPRTQLLGQDLYDIDVYYPHRDFNLEGRRKIAEKEFLAKIESGEDNQFIVDTSARDAAAEDGDISNILFPDTPKQDDFASGRNTKINNMKRREYGDTQIPGWDMGPRAYFKYMESVIRNNHNKALAYAGAKSIDDFNARIVEKYGSGHEHMGDFLKMYLSNQVMTSTIIPERMLDYKSKMNMKESGYYYFTDSYFLELDSRIAHKLGTDPMLADNNPMRPYRISELANMEAKYSLITLLSRMKTGFMNIYGAGTILASDVGVKNALRAWNFKEVQRVLPFAKNWDDAIRYAENNGAMESIVRNEVLASQAYGNKQNRRGLNMMLDAIKKNPSIKTKELWDIGRSYGLTDNIMNIAALPMRYSERLMRTRSFFAQYMKAVDVLEATGVSAIDHPWALAMARKGVATTQFMYNNANRPAFTRSNVGKIFSRFKLWAANSVKFRADAYNEMMAAQTGGETIQSKRFNDILMMDMFMLALAGLYPFSIFGNSIPEPYGWMQDLVDWAFGDEKEKEMAFRGGQGLPHALAPLAVTLPPSSRLLTAWIDPIVRGDWDSFASYTVWTLFPFGLTARDTKQAMQSPGKIIDRMTGIPLYEAHRDLISP